MTACILIAGILSALKRVPLTNRIGDNGNAYFGIAYDTYLFFFLFYFYNLNYINILIL